MGKLVVKIDELLPRLQQVVAVVNSKNSMPILADVVFQVRKDNGLTMTTSDAETWLTVATPCVEFDEPMTFCVIAQDIFKVFSNLKGKVVEMVLDQETHTLKCSYSDGKGRFALPYEGAEEFPRPNMDMTGSKDMHINATNLACAIDKATFAIANDKIRPIMNGIHFDFFEYGMVAVATDGQKLGKHLDKTITSDETQIGFFTLPRKPCTLLASILNGCESDIHVVFNDKSVSFGNSEFKMHTRLLEGNYPKYERVIPTDNTIETTIDKVEFMDALRRVLPLGNQSSELVKLSFRMGEMTISAEDFSFSKSADETLACDYASQELSIGFNGGYLMEILQSIQTDMVKICLKDQTRAGLFKPTEDGENEEYVALLMPIFI